MSVPDEPQPSAPAWGRLGALGEWCARHFPVVLAGWLLVLGGVAGLSRAFGGSFSDDFTLPGVQSVRAIGVLRAHDPAAGGYSAPVVLHDAGHPLTTVAGRINRAAAQLRRLPHVLAVQNPLPPPSAAAVPPPPPTPARRALSPLSPDGRTGYLTIRFDSTPLLLGQDYLRGIDRAVAPLLAAGVQVEYGGPLGELARPLPNDRVSELIGIGAAVVVLLAGFGSVVAAVLPLLTALFGVVTGLACLGLLAAAFTFSTVSPTLATMIGLGVGIDYALFLITRHRQHLIDGLDPVAAAGRAMATSGRAVVVSGCTVIVALAGLWVSGISLVGKLGTAAALTVITAVLTALTLVPALLGLAGRRIDRLRVRTPVAEADPRGAAPRHTGRHRYARRVQRRPWAFLAGGLAATAVLAVPLFSIQLGHIGDGADPTGFTDRRAYDLISTAFGPGANGPLTIVIDQSTVPASRRPALAKHAQHTLAHLPGTVTTTALRPTPDGKVLTATTIATTAPQDAATTRLVNRLRDTVLPKAVAGTSAHGYVTGTTAVQVDFVDMVAGRLPLIIGVVVALAFLIILAVFRGLLVALKAAVLNVVSIAASYGVIVAVFQWGWGSGALGVSQPVPIESFVPMMMFAIVFGLSMDYEIFLLTRVHESWLRTGDTPESVARALETTARVITCAALIMTSVFAAFVNSPVIVVKMLAVGLAVSVLIDATLIRLVLVPATMTLLDRANWWLPGWLDRALPRLRRL
ncbi:MMPL family transporter [Streptomyces orinoci]|uniref:MMPL family transporter n=1 Tax=Streptomyces orinoci TaxID=67339 RepID=A0ABV3K0B3_STRON|nr:MMPL family transporter [Streptomyces orinoci]